MKHSVTVQQAYTAIVDHFIRTGRAPHYTELASLTGVSPDAARDLQRAAAASAMGSWLTPDTDYIGSWAPFSNVPTQYRVSVSGERKWYGQGGLESLAVRWLFPGQEVAIDSHCLDCGEPFQVLMKDDAILAANPATLVAHVNIAFSRHHEFTDAYRGSYMNLFRSEEHVKTWSLYDPISEESIMPLKDWAQLLSHPLFTQRLKPDYLSRTPEYISEFFAELRRWGKTGPFWTQS